MMITQKRIEQFQIAVCGKIPDMSVFFSNRRPSIIKQGGQLLNRENPELSFRLMNG